MNQNCSIKHVALDYSNKKKADTFFIDILGLNFEKKFNLKSEISNSIFGIKKDVEIVVYKNEKSYFEIFLTKPLKKTSFHHVCIEINNQQDFIERCRKHGLKPFIVDKNGKKLLFVRDFSNNLYEVKEK